MAFDNVVPIDEDAARLLARRQIRFRWFVTLLALAYLGALVPTLLLTPLPPLVPFVSLAILVVLAEHRFVLFGDETSMSASIIVVVASVFVFSDSAPLAGPLLIGSLGGLYLPHLRRGCLALLLANTSALGISAALAAATTLCLMTDGDGEPSALLRVATAVVVYWCVNSALIGSASAVRQGSDPAHSVWTQAISEWPLLLLGMSSALLALTRASATHEALVAVGIGLVAFEFRVHGRRQELSHAWDRSWQVAAVVGLAATIAQTGLTGASVAMLGLFLVVSESSRSGGPMMALSFSILAAFSTAIATTMLGADPPVRFLFAAGCALVCASAVQATLDQQRLGVRLPTLVTVGLTIPGAFDIAVVSATAVLLIALALVPELAVPPLALIAATLVLRSANPRSHKSVGDVAASCPRNSQGASL